MKRIRTVLLLSVMAISLAWATQSNATDLRAAQPPISTSLGVARVNTVGAIISMPRDSKSSAKHRNSTCNKSAGICNVPTSLGAARVNTVGAIITIPGGPDSGTKRNTSDCKKHHGICNVPTSLGAARVNTVGAIITIPGGPDSVAKRSTSDCKKHHGICSVPTRLDTARVNTVGATIVFRNSSAATMRHQIQCRSRFFRIAGLILFFVP